MSYPDDPIFGSRYSLDPMPGQMAFDLPAAGERNTFAPIEPTLGCRRWGHRFNPTTNLCNRCGFGYLPDHPNGD